MQNWILAQDGCDGFSQISSSTGELTYEKELAYVGDFYKASEDLEFSITEEFIDHWCRSENSMSMAEMEIPLPSKHTEESGFKKGKVSSFSKKIDSQGRTGLFGKVAFDNQEAADKFKNSGVSIYVKKDVTVPTTKEFITFPVTHVALTDYPVLPGMDSFTEVAASLNAEPAFTKNLFKKEGDKMNHVLKLAETLDIDVEDAEDAATKISGKFKELSDTVVSLSDEIKAIKKPEEKKKDLPVISASMFDMMQENRENKITKLLEEGYVTPAQVKDVEAKYLNKEAIVLALSSEGDTDDFNWFYKNALKGGKNALHGDGETGLQVEETILSLSDIQDPKKNSLLKTIESRYATA